MQSKRPPNLSLQIGERPPARTVIELPTPVEEPAEDLHEEASRSSSPASSSSDSQEAFLEENDAISDDLSKDLALLEQLRRSVHKNLRLRPIRSASGSIRSQHTPELATSSSQSSDSPSESAADAARQRTPSPDSAFSPASAYFTPLTEFGATPISALHHSRHTSLDVQVLQAQMHVQQPAKPPASAPGQGVSPALLLARLSTPTRPLLIDTRPVAAFSRLHLPQSVNIAIPSLILRRSRKPANAFHSLEALRQYITTDESKRVWDDLMAGHDWDGDVIVYDEIMLPKDRNNHQATAWAIMELIAPLLAHGSVDFLEGGFAAARKHPYLSEHMVAGTEASDPPDVAPELSSAPVLSSSIASTSKKQAPVSGLAQLDTLIAARSKKMPEIEQPVPSPQPLMPTAINSWNIEDFMSPSPAPSATVFSRPQPPRRPSIPTLRRLDTERASPLPKLQVPAGQSKPHTLAAPSGANRKARSRSPSHLNLVHSNHSPPPSALLLSPPNPSRDLVPPHSPAYSLTPRSAHTPLPRSPATARPEMDQPPTTEEPFPEFSVSTILPNFLFLGPELTLEEHVEMLLANGVKRIINIAAECDDDHGLRLRDRFERYVHIPMRDTVEEDNITRGVREVCQFLDDARLHSAPTYVHCKAGKSRSVTAVMAYLIHANHWTLSRAYTFVLERRKGISPNIGFVSELMTFEEQELGGKSVGVVKMAPAEPEPDAGAGGPTMTGNYGVALGGRRPQHLRESLPPAFSAQHSLNLVPTLHDAAQLGDSQQELEIKDAEGRYRHARRAPVDETTLQPMRRVSKAGLESAVYL
ncbi:dual-specificity phosphatase domain-containing protein [Phanerochaete sordida]|uniref:protein-tyrosine-phosphatase n=1 Tax=Phanerochaete sordida TaxID=48140 RepID=A0A9P3GK51_9APHY|nr:dual-specificity phosphatase domain-containing protein [Phanerochaete sordida]